MDESSEPELGVLGPLRDVDASLLGILDQVREHCGASRASLFLRDPGTGDLVTRVAHLEEIGRIRVPHGAGVVGAAVRDGRTVGYPEDVPVADPGAVASIGWTPDTMLAVPIRIDEDVVGALQVIDPSPDRPFRRRAERLAIRLARVLEGSSLAAQLRPRGERTVALAYGYEGVVGDAAPMKRAFGLAARVAGTDASVMLTGETGTGKELLARAIHANSRRASAPLVKVDCGAIPDSLIENEFFGHEKGAYTGATGAAPGLFEQADGGTLFLDEVGELSLMAQTRLLRVLNDHVVRRLGSSRSTSVDFRLIAATHVDLAARVDAGSFRLDLLHRLQVVRIRLPSLKERGRDDILRLVEHFADLHGRRHGRPVAAIPGPTQDLLASRDWPGNVRELSHAVEAAVVLSSDGVLVPDLFASDIPPREVTGHLHPFAAEPTLDALETEYLRFLMRRHGGSRQEVARIAGIGRSTLWRKLKALGDEEPG